MTCIHCGQSPLSMRYELRCTPETREPRVVELHLCTACLQCICADPDVELLDQQVSVSAR